jgi:hypothetical protein
MQVLMTLLNTPRLSREVPELNTTSITDPKKNLGAYKESDYKTLLLEFKQFVQTFKFSLGEGKPPILERYHIQPRMRMTNGPNGDSTLNSSPKEAKALVMCKNL